jgi:hypothetical protein
MPKIVGYREVVHQPVMFDFGRGRVWGGSGGMFAGGSAGGGFVGGGQAPEGGMVIGGMGRVPRRGNTSWRRPRRGGLGFLSRRTRSGMASGVMTSAVWMLGLPAAVGAGVAYLKRKDEDTITRWAIWGGLIGLAAQVLLTVTGVTLTGLFLRSAMRDPWSTAGRVLQTAAGQAQQAAGMGRC